MSTEGQTPVLRLLHALKPVRDGDVANPVPGAPADAEMKAFVRSESVQTAYSYGLIALESAGDHLAAYDALVLMQAFSMAPLTCLRGLLEAAAVASWQLDPSIWRQRPRGSQSGSAIRDFDDAEEGREREERHGRRPYRRHQD